MKFQNQTRLFMCLTVKKIPGLSPRPQFLNNLSTRSHIAPWLLGGMIVAVLSIGGCDSDTSSANTAGKREQTSSYAQIPGSLGNCVHSVFEGHGYIACDGLISWQDARNDCLAMGGNLVTVNSSGENNHIVSQMTVGSWIGYTDGLFEGSFGWVGGGGSGFTNWCGGEPNNIGDEDCAEVGLASCWNDVQCSAQRGYICEIICDDGDPCTTDTYDAQAQSCAAAFNYSSSGTLTYLQCPGAQSWQLAANRCAAQNMSIVSIHSGAENGVVTNLAVSLGGTSHIGHTDGLIEGSFGWYDGTPVDYTNWCSGEPNNVADEDCVQITSSGCWNDIQCSASLPFVCRVQCDDGNPCTDDLWNENTLSCDHTAINCGDNNVCTEDSCDPGSGCVHSVVDCNDGDPCTVEGCDPTTGCSHTLEPVLGYNGGGYRLCAGTASWADAHAACSAMGMNLATLTTADENGFVETTYAQNPGTHYWVGGQETATEGVYAWDNNEPFVYTDWCPSEPNNVDGNEGCLELVGATMCWNDLPCTDTHSFICETDCDDSDPCTDDNYDLDLATCQHTPAVCDDGNPCTTDSCQPGVGCEFVRNEVTSFGAKGHLVCGQANFGEAVGYCEDVGMNITTIQNTAENTHIQGLVTAFGSGSATIGYTDGLVEGSFGWYAGFSALSAWCDNEPNNAGDEDCTELYAAIGCWNDYPCAENRAFVCEIDCDDYNGCTDDVFDVVTQTCTYTPIECVSTDPCIVATCIGETGECELTPILGCGFEVTAISPTATELGVTRTFTLTGGGFESGITVDVFGANLMTTTVINDTEAEIVIELPTTPGTVDVSVSDAFQTIELTPAINVLGWDELCDGVLCEPTCIVDADCVEGDVCTADFCLDGTCEHDPSPDCCQPGGDCDVCTLDGDVNGDGVVSIVDGQCLLLTSLWVSGNKGTKPPKCMKRPFVSADLDCDGLFSTADIILMFYKAAKVVLAVEIDEDGDGCHDNCGSPFPL